MTASSALTGASSAPSAVLATERKAALAGSGWASSEAMRFFMSASAGAKIVERLAQAGVFGRGAVKLQCGVGEGLGQRVGRARPANSVGETGRLIGAFLPVVGQRALGADGLGARNDMRLDVRLLAGSEVVPHGVLDVLGGPDRIGAVGHGDALFGVFLTLRGQELALVGVAIIVARCLGSPSMSVSLGLGAAKRNRVFRSRRP